ncbi:MAG: alpha/beta fold hydrolase [Sandaracinaceae bacterium]
MQETVSAEPVFEERFARLPNGIELCYDVRGEGSPILLVMGIGAQLIFWPEEFCDRLAERGHRVIRFDHRDVGRSTWLDDAGVPPLGPTLLGALVGRRVAAPYALEDMAGDVAGLLDVLDIDSAHVVGVSMGGMIAQTMAITHPHRMRSLTSIMSTTGRPTPFISDPRALRALFSNPPRTREQAQDHAQRFWTAIGSTGFEIDVREVRARAGAAWDRGSNPKGFLRHLAAIGATGDRTSRLRFVRMPTQVIHGTVDPLLRPIGGRWTAEAIDGARLTMIEGMGHDLPRGVWPRLLDMIDSLAARADAESRTSRG